MTLATITTPHLPAPALAPADAAQEWIRRWLNSLKADSTKNAYRAEIARFIAWLGGDPAALFTVDRAIADEWREHLTSLRQRNGKPLSAFTINRKLSAVSSLYQYAVDEGWLARNPFARVQRLEVDNVGVTPGLSRRQLATVLFVAVEHSHRAYTLVLTLAATAMRVSEALSMRLEEFEQRPDQQTGIIDTYAKVTRKRGKRQWVVLPAPVVAAINMLAQREGRTAGPVFATRSGNPMDRTDVYDLLRRLGEKANAHLPPEERLAGLHPHMLRVCAITDALAAGEPLHRVQDLAGHEDPRTTRRYDRNRNRGRLSPAHKLAASYAALVAERGSA